MLKEKKLPSYRSWNRHVEYRNVDMAHECAQYANDHKPLWSFRYFRQISIITWVLASSMRQGAKKPLKTRCGITGRRLYHYEPFCLADHHAGIRRQRTCWPDTFATYAVCKEAKHSICK